MLPYGLGLRLASFRGVCVLCAVDEIESGFLCASCDEKEAWRTEPVRLDVAGRILSVHCANYYTGVMKNAMASFKDQENLHSLPYLVHAIAKAVEALSLPAETLILPMPTTHGRLRERGFYPAGILARYVSALTGFGLYTGVIRTVESVHQRYLDKESRQNNLSGVFFVDTPPQAESLLLFDDVMTTGSTFKELASTLWQFDDGLALSGLCLAHGKAEYDAPKFS
ncbi:MAG: hypothetical protein Q4B88_04370 [Moraxella sp.]|nr:hypothetical protein [Moraxella sp.]